MSAQPRYDVIVIGAGIVGSSVTMALAERGRRTLTIDVDLSGRLSSSEKNAGGVRATWWEAVNIILCRASINYYESIASEVGFRQKGYLWLYDADTWPKALAHIDLQRRLGHPIETLRAPDVHQRVPEIDRLEGIAGATFSPRDGLINPNLLKNHYRGRDRRAQSENHSDRTNHIEQHREKAIWHRACNHDSDRAGDDRSDGEQDRSVGPGSARAREHVV